MVSEGKTVADSPPVIGRAADAHVADGDSGSAAYQRYALGLLLLIYILNFLDRQIINILAEPIRVDLGLRDWQLGAMTGLSFAVLYAVLGIPVARLAERKNRPLIIAAATAIWSIFTVLCGFAQNFIQLFLARVGVGVGEAGCTPPAHSLISDYVPRSKRASALATYAMGGPIGSLIGLSIGGLAVDIWGWRTAFVIAGVPGIILAVVAALTLREPRELIARERRPPVVGWREALAELRDTPTFWLFCGGGAIQGFIAYGHIAFLGSFFFRNHADQLGVLAASTGLEIAGFLGIALGLLHGLSTIIGTYAGGKLGDRLGTADPRALASICAIANLVAVPTYIVAMLVQNTTLALLLLAIPAISAGFSHGPLYAVIQSVVKPRTRATATAIFLFSANLIGPGLGPLLVGILSDFLSESVGMGPGEGLRYAQIGITFIGIAGAWFYWRARRYIRQDMKS